ncbi:hypothetical protein [Lichenifustis flavocetrariae]|uniref:Uncharacterized protein n=1 Tax=Lichenifustis flavocetrariae TaxID=2949735 RepID=A0AA42CLY6_9HYPH|nr:hypothetical protein [Lichenifustis flavocetrariae]MCW6510951.1 hypothetical protein [Lichenifustis flavocetrariae]
MPTDVADRFRSSVLEPSAQAAFLTYALATADALIVSRALRDVAAPQGQSYGFGDDLALSIVLAAIEALDIDLTVRPRT